MKRYITIAFLFFVFLSFGQRKYAADRYFKEFAYVKSAELYYEIYKKGDSTQLVLERLGDSYYFNTKTEESEKWYSKLFQLYEKDSLAPEYYFRYAQSLKSNGKYQESDAWLLKLKNINKEDSRVNQLIKYPNYFKLLTNKKKQFVNFYNVSTNTKYSDYGVFMFGDEVLFSSTRPNPLLKRNKLYKWNKQPFLNLYRAKDTFVTTNNQKKVLDLYKTEKLTSINTKYHEASAVITKDGKTMYFTRDNYDGKALKGSEKRVSHLKIYKAEWSGNQWINIIELPFNSDEFSTGQPALSPNEDELFFVSDMPGGFGKTDLYKVKILENNTFGKPVNLGNKINTEGREMFPFISADEYLYFSSDGHIGLGALDVFESKIIASGFATPTNLGAPVNSGKDDFSFVINKKNDKGYFSSNRSGGKGDDDIYSFAIYNCNEFLSGTIVNETTKEIIAGAKVKLVDKEGKIIQSTITDNKGFYSFGKVSCETNYSVVAEKTEYKSSFLSFATKNIDQYTNVVNLSLTPLIVEKEIVLNPIRFDFDKYNIREDAEYELEHVVSVMKSYPDLVIKIESHTDSRGDNKYNKILSDKRAKSTKDYIISRGIAANRIESAIGYGEEKLLNNCTDANAAKCTKEEHQLNRRSYFFIVKGNYIKAVNK